MHLPGSLLVNNSRSQSSSSQTRQGQRISPHQIDMFPISAASFSKEKIEKPGKMEKMLAGMGKCSKIRHIVRLRQMLLRWRSKARISSAPRTPSDVPAGHVAVCVGAGCRRFVVRATYLNHPVFKKLLSHAEEEYGFTNQGPLTIPCDESLFEEVIRFISRSGSGRLATLEDLQRSCHAGQYWPESRPLLHALSDQPMW